MEWIMDNCVAVSAVSIVSVVLLHALIGHTNPKTHEQRVEEVRLDALARYDAKVNK